MLPQHLKTAPADPTIGGATPTAPLTRSDIYHQVEEENRVLKRLHDQQACLDRAEATRLDAKITQAESDLALLVAQRADLPNAAGTASPTTPARRAAQTALASAPPSAATHHDVHTKAGGMLLYACAQV